MVGKPLFALRDGGVAGIVLSMSNTQYLTNAGGERVAVVLPLPEYEALLEDLRDLAVIAERRDEPRLTLAEVKQQLRADGLL